MDNEKFREAHQRLWELLPPSMRENGYWLVASVKGAIGWPEKVQSIAFRGKIIFLVPGNSFFYPSVCVKLESNSVEAGKQMLMHFLSSLAWVHQHSIRIVHFSGGNLPRPVGKDMEAQVVTKEISFDYFPDPQDPKVRRALALFREGLSLKLQHNGYAYLSFFKIINILKNTGQSQQEWIEINLAHIREWQAKKRLGELQSQQQNIGAYLYKTNRCAIAHAFDDTSADPENVEDDQRFYDDLPLIQELAKIAIEREFGIKTSDTIWREHLYELEGFRNLLGVDLVNILKSSGSVSPQEISFPSLTVGLRNKSSYQALENLYVEVLEVKEGRVVLRCSKKNLTVQSILVLDFIKERLLLDPYEGIVSFDDGSVKAARQKAEVLFFTAELIGNGELEVKNAETDQILGRCDAFLPYNIDLGRTLDNYQSEAAQWMNLAKQRAEK